MSYESLVKDTFVHMLSLQMKQPNLSPIILQRVAEQPCIDIRQKLKVNFYFGNYPENTRKC